MTATPAVLCVVGPTATGKSDLALDLADALGGPDAVEVVNADSMQVYVGMDIGTAKLRPDQRRGIAHHLLDVWPVSHPVTVAEYQQHARAAVKQVRARGRRPLLVGGSGLYLSAVVDDLRFPGTDPAVRSRLEAELAELGPGPLHQRLADRDPAAAAKVLPSNGRRIVRALEVVELTGGPFRADLPTPGARSVYPAVLLGVDREPAELDARIGERVGRMWAGGLLEEVARLEEQGLSRSRTARHALGYRQALAQRSGELTGEEAVAATVLGTRRFARRQRTWFRRDPRVRWLDGAAPDLLVRALRTIEA